MRHPRALFPSAVLTATLAVGGLSANAQIHNGSSQPAAANLAQQAATAEAQFPSVLGNALTPESVAAVLSIIHNHTLPAGTGVTDFDNVDAPCLFSETNPLLGPEQSAVFIAPSPNGGAILNQCAEFGIDAHSQPNFLAFNSTSPLYPSGGTARSPELIYFEQPSTANVSLWISCGLSISSPVAVVAYGTHGVLGVVVVRPTETWQQLTITTPGIIAISLVGNPMILLVDDILSR